MIFITSSFQSLTKFTREFVLLRCWIGTLLWWSLVVPMEPFFSYGALLFPFSLIVLMKPHCFNGAFLFGWSLTVPMESHCSDGGASFQQNLVLQPPETPPNLFSWQVIPPVHGYLAEGQSNIIKRIRFSFPTSSGGWVKTSLGKLDLICHISSWIWFLQFLSVNHHL